jgi:uncharacterized protein (TIGR00251 family)
VTSSLRLRVQPGARASGLVGWMADGTLKLKVSAPAEDGRANRAVEALLAETLGVRVAAVKVVRGHSARSKTVDVDGLDEQTIASRITAALAAREEAPGAQRALRRKGRHDGG